MIVDSSAIVAILHREPEAIAFMRRIREAPAAARLSAANYVEIGLVIDRLGDAGLSREIDELIADIPIEIIPVSPEHARIAREAHRRFGRGSGSRARLNFGDCFAYALARQTGEPLLFKGNDFAATDIIAA